MGKWLQALKEERAKLSVLDVETSEKIKTHPYPQCQK
jgi:hypothetical protein